MTCWRRRPKRLKLCAKVKLSHSSLPYNCLLISSSSWYIRRVLSCGTMIIKGKQWWGGEKSDGSSAHLYVAWVRLEDRYFMINIQPKKYFSQTLQWNVSLIFLHYQDSHTVYEHLTLHFFFVDLDLLVEYISSFIVCILVVHIRSWFFVLTRGTILSESKSMVKVIFILTMFQIYGYRSHHLNIWQYNNKNLQGYGWSCVQWIYKWRSCR